MGLLPKSQRIAQGAHFRSLVVQSHVMSKSASQFSEHYYQLPRLHVSITNALRPQDLRLRDYRILVESWVGVTNTEPGGYVMDLKALGKFG
jgi:hypothetical protein